MATSENLKHPIETIGPVPESKKKTVSIETIYLNNLPSSELYEKSFMHRDCITHILLTKTDFLITASIDGYLKFWKKEISLEFVKTFKSHLAPISALCSSPEGLLLASGAADKTLKIYDVINFDMINMIKLDFEPAALAFMYQRGSSLCKLAVARGHEILIFDAKGNNEPISIHKLHKASIVSIAYVEFNDSAISTDSAGHIEYWSLANPSSYPSGIEFNLKSSTDLYELAKFKTFPLGITLSQDAKYFALICADRQIRVFNYSSGKLFRKYDESITTLTEDFQNGMLPGRLDELEFGKRIAIERDIDKYYPQTNALFDDSGRFLIYPCLSGIKVINLHTNELVRLLGKTESVRFLYLALYQGTPKRKGLLTMEMMASDNPAFKDIETIDPVIFCTAYQKSRFYIFSSKSPESDGHIADRDVMNEKPKQEDAPILLSQASKGPLSSHAIMHTTKGDIHLQLFPDKAPKAVENFAGLSRSGYYNSLLFHRVVKGFMIQGGDPNGDGTGGASIWGHEFVDEIVPDLKFDKPYMLAMANAGPNTNASQFFITVVNCPWLNGKHTIFGRVISGMDAVHAIETTETNNRDKPKQDIKIIDIVIQ